ncbi:C4b-binding protein alpha chain-like [Polypterus senegalus]|uniref:C4b-binding protein alpha chain-like n=1 Tax=Polypterus senegalus TaxID=55291 RepID=UPI0019622DFC|nr:C4b-binding protein alpha chain-like [Polypterus senegalus]
MDGRHGQAVQPKKAKVSYLDGRPTLQRHKKEGEDHPASTKREAEDASATVGTLTSQQGWTKEHVLNYDCVAKYEGSSIIRSADNTTMIGLICGDDEATYRKWSAAYLSYAECFVHLFFIFYVTLEIHCPLVPVENGRITAGFGSPVYRSIVTFACNHGYMLEGSDTIMCQQNGQWSSKPPTCSKMNICRLPNIENGWVTNVNPPYTYDDSIEFACKDGYLLKGAKRVSCKKYDTWYPLPPKCEQDPCQAKGVLNYVECKVKKFFKKLKDAASDLTLG